MTAEEFAYSSPDGKHVSTACYGESEIRELERQCEQAVSYMEYGRLSSMAAESRKASGEWSLRGDEWPKAYASALKLWRSEKGGL